MTSKCKLHKISSNDADSFLYLLHQVVPDLSTRVWTRSNWYTFWLFWCIQSTPICYVQPHTVKPAATCLSKSNAWKYLRTNALNHCATQCLWPSHFYLASIQCTQSICLPHPRNGSSTSNSYLTHTITVPINLNNLKFIHDLRNISSILTFFEKGNCNWFGMKSRQCMLCEVWDPKYNRPQPNIQFTGFKCANYVFGK